MAAVPNAQAIFHLQYEAARRDEIVGILLALFLGTFGAHHFYLRRTGLGILYCCLFWTGIPAVAGFIEAFFMPNRVREFNAREAALIAQSLGIGASPWAEWAMAPMVPAVPWSPRPADPAAVAPMAMVPCMRCQSPNPQGSSFCSGCGARL